MARGIVPYDGYPAPNGAKLYAAGDIFAPANYQAGGNNYSPQAFGMYGRIENVLFSPRSQSANYFALAFFPANSSTANEARATGANSVAVKWYTANGTEVANNSNISAEVCQFQVWGQ